VNGDKSLQNNRLLWWIMGIIGTVFLALAAAWANSMHESVDKFGVALDTNTKELRAVVQSQAERIVKLETYSDVERQDIAALRQQLTRVETKVDELKK